MSTVTVTAARNIDLAEGAHSGFPGETSTLLNKTIVYFDHQAQAVAGGDTISIDLAAALTAKLRNGKTITVRSATMHQCGYDITNGRALGFKTVAYSSPNLTFIPTTSDFSTNAAIAATDKLERPFAAVVAYSES